jgi:hypothetical protein
MQLDKTIAGFVGPGSQDRLRLGSGAPVSGSKHGTHRSYGSQSPTGTNFACAATCGTSLCRHRPSAPPSETHVFGMYWPLASIDLSGAQTLLPSGHDTSKSASSGGTTTFGRQCIPSSAHGAHRSPSLQTS